MNQFAVLPSNGGGTRHFELGRELVRRGWKVTVVASDFVLHSRLYSRRSSAADGSLIMEEADGVTFAWVHSTAYADNNWRRARNWASFAIAARRVASAFEDASIIIGSSPQPLAALAGYRAARQLGVPFVLEIRDLWPESLEAVSGRRSAAYHVIRGLMRFLYPRAERVIVLAKGVGDYLADAGTVPLNRIVYAPNGIDSSVFTEREDAVRPAFTALYAGAHGPANGLDTVLDAAHLLRDQTEIRFMLVGDGPIKQALKAAAAARRLPNVEFLDPVPKRDMPALLARADGGLMVLRDSPLFAFGVSPNKLFDYLGAGLPVICNVPGDVAHMVADARAGVQTTDSTAPALAAAVRELAARAPADRGVMGRAGQEWVRREHARDVVGARLDAGLRALLK